MDLVSVGSEIRVSDKYIVRLVWQMVYRWVGQLAGESIQFDVKLSLQLNINLTASLSKIEHWFYLFRNEIHLGVPIVVNPYLGEQRLRKQFVPRNYGFQALSNDIQKKNEKDKKH